MKQRLISLFAALSLTLTILAQATQPCVVKQYNQKQQKTPLAGVQVEVRGAQTATSAANGAVSLKFATLKPGDRVPFRAATKAGFELMNKTAVEQWNISRDQKPFEIVLIQSAYFTQLKGKLKQSSIDSYHEKYEKARAILEKLQKEGKMKEEEYLRRLNELEDRYDNQLKNLDAYVDQFARIDLSELSEQEQQFIELAHAGRLDEAAEAYNSLNAAGKYITAVENVRKLNEDIAKLENEKAQQQEAANTFFAILQRQVNTLKLAGGEENYKKAGELLKRAALADTTNVDVVHTYAQFAYMQKDYKDAEWFFRICLNLITDDDVINKMLLYNNLGSIYYFTHDYVNAKDYLLLSLNIAMPLFNQDPDIYRFTIAGTQNNLGALFTDLQDYTLAEEYLLAAFENRTCLFKQEPDTFRVGLAMTQVNLGNLYKRSNKYDKAEEFFLAALENYNHLFSLYPDLFRPELAQIQNNLGALYSDDGNFEQAELFLFEALKNANLLFESNPGAYRSVLAMTQHNIGLMYFYKQNYTETEKYYLASLENLLQLFAQEPNAYRASLARMQRDLGELYSKSLDYDKAIGYYSVALDNYNKLYAQEPDAYLINLALLNYDIGSLNFDVDNYAEAEKHFHAAVDLLSSDPPIEFRSKLAASQIGLALTCISDNDMDNAERQFLVALENYKQLFTEEPDDYCEKLALVNYLLGSMYYDIDKYVESEKYLLASVEYSTPSYEPPHDYRNKLAITQIALSIISRKKGNYDDAERHLFASLENIDLLFSREPDEYRSILAYAQYNLGLLYQNTSNLSKSEEYHLKALENYTLLSSTDSDTFRNNLASIQICLGQLYFEKRDYFKAEDFLLKALENHKTLLHQNPDADRFDLMKTKFYLGNLYNETKDYSKAEDYYVKACEDMTHLYHQNPETYSTGLTSVLNALAYLYAKTQKYSQALDTIDRAIALTPEDANLYDSKGEILLMKGDEKEAVKMWQKVLELEPNFLKKYEGGTDFYKQLKEKGLIIE